MGGEIREAEKRRISKGLIITKSYTPALRCGVSGIQTEGSHFSAESLITIPSTSVSSPFVLTILLCDSQLPQSEIRCADDFCPRSDNSPRRLPRVAIRRRQFRRQPVHNAPS